MRGITRREEQTRECRRHINKIFFFDETDRSMSCETHHQVYKNYKLINSHVRYIEHKVTSNKVCVTNRLGRQLLKIF